MLSKTNKYVHQLVNINTLITKLDVLFNLVSPIVKTKQNRQNYGDRNERSV